METKTIKIYVEQRTSKDGRKFNVFHTFSKHDRRLEVKFRNDCNNVPTKNCYITVDVNECNVTKGEYPVLWVKSIVSVQALEEVSAEKNRKTLDEFFN